MKILLFVEGDTEESLPLFIRRWLDPKLPRRVAVKAVNFEGIGDYLTELAKRASDRFKDEDVGFVFGLVDLYGLPRGYVRGADIRAKVKFAREKIEKLLPAGLRSRFSQHFAVHETEAWLLAQPGLFPRIKIPRNWSEHPERVDMAKPPSKRLQELFRTQTGSGYKKTVQARILFPKLAPDQAYSKCPHLKALLDDLLAVARKL